MALAEVSVVPIGTGNTSVSRYVAQAVRVLEREKGISYTVTGMGTIIEGDLDRLFDVIKRMHQSVIDAGALRVYTVIKIDDRRDKPSTAEKKVESLKQALGHGS